MRTTAAFLFLALLLAAPPAHAGDEDAAEDPTPRELATMILDGNDAEHALVAAWLEGADRAALRAVFRDLRALRTERRARPRPTPRVRATKERDFRLPLPPDYVPPGSENRPVVTAEVRVIDIASDGAAELLGAQRPTGDSHAVKLTQEQADRLLRAVEKSQDAKVVSAPRITVYDGQKANVSVLNQVSYIKDYDIQVTKEGKVADPVVDVVQEGTIIELRPSVDAAAKSIGMDFQGTFASIQRPIPEVEVEVDGPSKVKIQVPEVRVVRVETKVSLPDGGWVLIGGGVLLEPKKGERVERLTLVHLTSLDIEGR